MHERLMPTRKVWVDSTYVCTYVEGASTLIAYYMHLLK